jgi:anti-sigma factor (TIGR02949 family)
MIDCREVMAKLWDFIDGELPRAEFEAIRGHLAECRRCYPHYAFEISFLQALAAVRTAIPAPSRALRDRVRALVTLT